MLNDTARPPVTLHHLLLSVEHTICWDIVNTIIPTHNTRTHFISPNLILMSPVTGRYNLCAISPCKVPRSSYNPPVSSELLLASCPATGIISQAI